VALTDTTLDTTTLAAIITDADTEIDSYLNARGVTGAACAELKSAALKLANAGLYIRTPQGSEGAWTTAASIKILRDAAFQILDNYLITHTAVGTTSTPRLSVVRNRGC